MYCSDDDQENRTDQPGDHSVCLRLGEVQIDFFLLFFGGGALGFLECKISFKNVLYSSPLIITGSGWLLETHFFALCKIIFS